MRIHDYAAITVLSSLALGQMEKRNDALYKPSTFENTAPAVGTPAPDLVLPDLDGRPWALSALEGRIVVLIKGGYT